MLIREAALTDAGFLLDLRNDELTRAMCKTHEPVERKTHIAWLTARLGRKTPDLYVAEINGVPVGTIRIDAGMSLSYATAPAYRGKGYATEMLQWAHDKFGVLIAEIYADNIPSIRAATKAGHNVVTMTRPLEDVSSRRMSPSMSQ